MTDINQRDNTKNQSSLDISHKHIFLFDNQYDDVVFNNNTGSAFELKPGLVVIRDTNNPTKVIPAVTGATLANIVGVISVDDSIADIADGADVNATYCHGGTINKDLLILPDGVTLATVPVAGGKTVGDILKGLGFTLESVTENTKSDN